MRFHFSECGFGQRQNLVLIRAGDQSCHKEWTRDILPTDRNWDICVSYYGEKSQYESSFEEIVVSEPGGFKFSRIYEIIIELGLHNVYDYFWFPDDDLTCSWGQVNNAFDIAAEYKLDLIQPALTHDSSFSHQITLSQELNLLRYVNFVELMMPLFSRAALLRCAPTFKGAMFGWGLDYAWPLILGSPQRKMAIVDSIPVKHGRQAGTGPLYKWAEKEGVDPLKEMRRNLDRFGCTNLTHTEFGAICAVSKGV